MKKIPYFFKFLLNLFLFIICFSIFKLINLFLRKKIKFINYVQSEIGSITWLDIFFRKNNYNKNNNIIICCVTGTHTANDFIESVRKELFKKNNIINIEHNLITFFIKPLFFFKNSLISEDYTSPNFDVLTKIPKLDWFEDKKKEYEMQVKSFFNLKKDDWFVCFFARDNFYDEIYRNNLSKKMQVRNSDINTYIKSMNFITQMGGYAIRVGRFQKNKIKNNNNKKIIDYSFLKEKNPKIDFLLMFFCKFCIGSSSGITDLTNLNNVPIGLVNEYEYIRSQGISRGTFIPKLLIDKNNKIVSKKDYDKNIGYPKSINNLYKKINLSQYKYLDNTEEEILMITKDFYYTFVENENPNHLLINDIYKNNELKIYEPFYDKYLK